MVAFVDAMEYSASKGKIITTPFVRCIYALINTWNEEIYLHFKGGVYKFIYTAKSTVDMSDVVVYKYMFQPEMVYVRPYAEFVSTVESERAAYPGQLRFTSIEKGILTEDQKIRLKNLVKDT